MSSPSNRMVPSVLSISRITMVEVVDLPQPDSPTRPTLSPRLTTKLMPSTALNTLGLGRGLALEHAGEPARALARILLDELLDHEQRLSGLAIRRVTVDAACRAAENRIHVRPFILRQQIAQRHAGARRRQHQLAGVGMRRRGENLARGRGLDHVALLHHHDAVAVGGGEAEIVGDQDGRHAALAGERHDEVHHGLLGGDVEPGGRLVGDQQLRPARQRERDDDALAHAARQFERIGVIALARPRDLDLVEDFDRPLRQHAGGIDLRVLPEHVLDLMPDLADRIERSARVLEDHRHFAPAQIAHLVFAGVADVEAGEVHRALGDAAGAVENAHHRVRGHRFSRAGLADDRQRLALGDGDIDVLDGAHDAAPGLELDREVTDVEQRQRFCHGDLTSGAADRRCRADRRRAG